MRLCILTLGSKGLKKDVRRRKLAGTRKIKLTGAYMYASPDKISSLLISLCFLFCDQETELPCYVFAKWLLLCMKSHN